MTKNGARLTGKKANFGGFSVLRHRIIDPLDDGDRTLKKLHARVFSNFLAPTIESGLPLDKNGNTKEN